MEWWAIALIWLACAIGCLLLGDGQGKPGKAFVYGLLFCPFALGVVLSEARSQSWPIVRTAWFARMCLTVGQVVSVLACAGSLLVCVWGFIRLFERESRSLGMPSLWEEMQPALEIVAAIASFFYHAGLWMVFSWVKRSILASLVDSTGERDGSSNSNSGGV